MRPVSYTHLDVYKRQAITSQHDKANLPTHIQVQGNASGLTRDSIVLLEQIRTIDKKRLKERMGRLDDTSMAEIDTALSISFGSVSYTHLSLLPLTASLASTTVL